MFLRTALARAILCLLFALHLTAAFRIDLHRRQDDKSASLITTQTESKPTQTQKPSSDQTSSDRSSVVETDAPKTTAASKTEDDSTTDTATATSTGQLSVTTNGTLTNDLFQNVTIPAGELPLAPVLTPGWGVAGAFMLVAGTAYTLIGIKNRTVHTFFSVAFSAALGISVLIIYVMSPPVSHALQGGYVAAAILSGCALGVGSVFFKELTEGLGCALGGFCVSMWLLTLVPGGLLTPVASKAIFIACFTVVGGAFYLSHYTRDWALISMISFAGATVIVLGIDCFSRAGLKEFWAYVWDLNKNLFPLGVETYPVTKGIRVQSAAIIIIFFVGVISQIKLWRVVREKRAQRAEERAKVQRDLEAEEANVGRQVEEATARDRRAWERVYGNTEAGESSISDNGSEKRLRESEVDSIKPVSEAQVYEMTDMTDSERDQQQAEPIEKDVDGKVTVRVAAEDAPDVSPFTDDGIDDPRNRSARTSESQSLTIPTEKRHQYQEPTSTEAPQVVPLPFTVPQDEEKETELRSNRSSVATFADDERNIDTDNRRQSLANRLSTGSSKLLRGLSQRSGNTKRQSRQLPDESSEELVITTKADREDDESSLVVTLDRQSIDSGRRSDFGDDEPTDIEVNARFSQDDTTKLQSDFDQDAKKHLSTNTVSETLANAQNATETQSHSEGPNSASQNGHTEKPKSTTSGVSARASLTKEHLPRTLSRVALSYRTNEWAKHLGYADTPEPDDITVADVPKAPKRDSHQERAAPVNIQELQQGVADGTPPPAIIRSDSRTSVASLNHVMPKRDSKQSLKMAAGSPSLDKDTQQLSPSMNTGSMSRSPSAMALRRNSPQFEPIVEERDQGYMGDTLRSKSSIPGVMSFNTPQTLLGQREMFLRNKSQGNLVGNTMTEQYAANQPAPAPSDAGSLHNYPMYAAAFSSDPDDLPLSQRKQLMHRQHSLSALSGGQAIPHMASSPDLPQGTPFNSHQPQRGSSVPTTAAREAQLANFRSSVQQDLRTGGAMITASGRETPFASTNNLLSGGREAEVQRSIEMQRNMLLNQKDQEAQRKEMTRLEKEWADKVFDERMRSGELMGAHREVMRKMQKNAKK